MLGVVMWQLMLRQRLPYPDVHDIAQVAVGLDRGDLDLRKSLPTSGSRATVALAEQARRCLDRDPTQRPSAQAVAQSLVAAARPLVRRFRSVTNTRQHTHTHTRHTLATLHPLFYIFRIVVNDLNAPG